MLNTFTPSYPNNIPAHNPSLHHLNTQYQTIRFCCFLLHLQSSFVWLFHLNQRCQDIYVCWPGQCIDVHIHQTGLKGFSTYLGSQSIRTTNSHSVFDSEETISVRYIVLMWSDDNSMLTTTNKAFIDIRLRPGIATLLMAVAAWFSLHASPYGSLRPNATSFIKPEVHNVSQCRQRRTEPRPQASACKLLWRSVQRFQRYAHSQTDRQTHRQTDGLITILFTRTGRGGLIINKIKYTPHNITTTISDKSVTWLRWCASMKCTLCSEKNGQTNSVLLEISHRNQPVKINWSLNFKQYCRHLPQHWHLPGSAQQWKG